MTGIDDRRDATRRYFLITVVVSLLLHFLFAMGYLRLEKLTGFELEHEKDPHPMQTKVVTESQLRQLQRQAQAFPADPHRQQVVETESSAETLPAKDRARLLSERTQRVARETVAKIFGSVTGGKAGPKAEPKPETPPPKTASKEALQKLGLSPGGPFQLEERDLERPKQGDETNGDSRLLRGNLDAVPRDIVAGAHTILNTDEYVYASFFNRVKAEVAPRWEPMVRRIMYDQQRRLRAGTYSTETNFWLDAAGQVTRVEISHPSGEPLFDEAAREALRRLPRMLNPPEALREADGGYRMQLGFMVYLEGGMGVRTDYVPDPRL